METFISDAQASQSLKESTFSCSGVLSPAKNLHALFYDQNLLEMFTPDHSTIFIDDSFEVNLPIDDHKQLLNLLTKTKNDKVKMKRNINGINFPEAFNFDLFESISVSFASE